MKRLQDELSKKEQKLKELDSHLNVVLHENREPDRLSRRSSLTRGSTQNVPGTSGGASSFSRSSSHDMMTRSASVKGKGKYGASPALKASGGAAVNENPGTVVGYTGAGPSGYSAGGSSRGNVVIPGSNQGHADN